MNASSPVFVVLHVGDTNQPVALYTYSQRWLHQSNRQQGKYILLSLQEDLQKLKNLGITDGYIRTNIGEKNHTTVMSKYIKISKGTGFVCRVTVENGLIVETEVD